MNTYVKTFGYTCISMRRMSEIFCRLKTSVVVFERHCNNWIQVSYRRAESTKLKHQGYPEISGVLFVLKHIESPSIR